MGHTHVALRAALLVSLVAKLLLWGWITTTEPTRFWDSGDTASYVGPGAVAG